MSALRVRPLWRWVLLVWVGAALVAMLVLQLPAISLPGNPIGLRGFQTPEVSSAMQLAQTFRMTADGLHAIEFYPARLGEATGMLRLELVDVSDSDEEVVRSQSVNAAVVVSMPAYRYEFSPILHSRNRTYRFNVASDVIQGDAEDPGGAHGVVVWATKGERYEPGSLLANGRTRWADLAFVTFAPTKSIWQTLVDPPSGPGRWRRHWVLAVLAMTWIALGVVLHTVSGLAEG